MKNIANHPERKRLNCGTKHRSMNCKWGDSGTNSLQMICRPGNKLLLAFPISSKVFLMKIRSPQIKSKAAIALLHQRIVNANGNHCRD